VKYRIKTERGRMAGGPMYVLERGMKTEMARSDFRHPHNHFRVRHREHGPANSIFIDGKRNVSHRAMDLRCCDGGAHRLVILGGIKKIAKVCETLVPFMAIFYVGGCIILLVMNASTIPATIQLIVQSAFSGHAMIGGFAGATMKEAIRYGVARGLFSNESAWVAHRSSPPRRKRKTRCARRSFLLPEHSGTRSLSARSLTSAG